MDTRFICRFSSVVESAAYIRVVGSSSLSNGTNLSGSVTDVSIRTYAQKPHLRDAALLNEGLKTGKIDIGAIPFYPTSTGGPSLYKETCPSLRGDEDQVR